MPLNELREAVSFQRKRSSMIGLRSVIPPSDSYLQFSVIRQTKEPYRTVILWYPSESVVLWIKNFGPYVDGGPYLSAALAGDHHSQVYIPSSSRANPQLSSSGASVRLSRFTVCNVRSCLC